MRKRKKSGPKPMLTTKVLKIAEREAANGLTLKQISVIIGVTASTLSTWKNRDGEIEEKLRQAIAKGKAKGLQRRLKRIERAAQKQWAADAWWIERQFPEQYGKTQHLRLSDADGNKIEPSTTVIAPTVVFVQPKKEQIADAVIELNGDAPKVLPNGLPSGNGKEASHE
jgi:transcriptional regulator with XRE-family HTH domain